MCQFKATKYTHGDLCQFGYCRCIHVVANLARGEARETERESCHIGAGRRAGKGKRNEGVGGVETWQDRGAGGRMAVRIYGRFITLPALPRLL